MREVGLSFGLFKILNKSSGIAPFELLTEVLLSRGERQSISRLQKLMLQLTVHFFNVREIVLCVFQSAYLGYFAVKAYEAKGYMSAALKLVLEQVFTSLGLHRIEANIQPNNIASLHLAQANGFKKEGYSPRYLKVDGEWCDHERWAMTYEDWSQLD